MHQAEKITIRQSDFVDVVNPLNQFRFDRFFISSMVDAKVIDQRTTNQSLLRLVVNAIEEVEQGIESHPDLFTNINPLNQSTAVLPRKGNTLLLDCLCYNEYLAVEDLPRFRQIAQNSNLTQFAPLLFNQIIQRKKDWTIDRGLEILNHSFATTYGSSMPVPGSDFDRYCREHRRDPRCWVASSVFRTATGRNLGSDVVTMSMLHMDGLIKDDQISMVYNNYLQDITACLGLRDVTTNAAIIVTEALEIEKRNKLWSDVLQINGTSSVYGPEGPFSDVCEGRSVTPICRLVQRFPLASALTVGMVKHKVLDKKHAIEEWEKLSYLMTPTDV